MLNATQQQHLQQAIQQTRQALHRYEALLSQGQTRNTMLGAIGTTATAIVADDLTGAGILNDLALLPLAVTALGTLILTEGPANRDELQSAYANLRHQLTNLEAAIRATRQTQREHRSATDTIAPTDTADPAGDSPPAPVQEASALERDPATFSPAAQAAIQERIQTKITEYQRQAQEHELQRQQTEAQTRPLEQQTALQQQMDRQGRAYDTLWRDQLSRYTPEQQQILQAAAQDYEQRYPNDPIDLSHPTPQEPSVWHTSIIIAASKIQAEPPLPPLEGYGEGPQPTLPGHTGYAPPEPLPPVGGFGEDPQPSLPNHMGHTPVEPLLPLGGYGAGQQLRCFTMVGILSRRSMFKESWMN